MISNENNGHYRPPHSRWIIVKKQAVNQSRLYTKRDYPAETSAAKRLDAGAFKLWCYISKNKPDYAFALSNAAAKKEYGIGKSQYDKGVKDLIALGYLVEFEGYGKNNYYFVEYPDKYKFEDVVIGDYSDYELLKYGNQTFKCDEIEQLNDRNQTFKSYETEQFDVSDQIEIDNSLNEKVLKSNNQMVDFQPVNVMVLAPGLISHPKSD